MTPPPLIALTPGEPAGIGPDLCLDVAAAPPADCVLAIIADPDLLTARAARLGIDVRLPTWDGIGTPPAPVVVSPVPLQVPATPGRLDTANASYVLATLEHATAGCLDGRFDALVTGPVQKSVINDAGIPFTGHTEWLAERAGVEHVVMMLVAGTLRVALATTHLPLIEVSRAITRPLLRSVLRILHGDLRDRFGIAQPTIVACGLNPHAGEGGHLGREEIEIIAPVIAELRAQGMELRGPVPADTAFTQAQLAGVDAVLAMYHDQGLPVLKHAGFGEAVNVTLGLPFIRTSVDHGTALDIAATGRADAGSLRAAIALALELSRASRSRA